MVALCTPLAPRACTTVHAGRTDTPAAWAACNRAASISLREHLGTQVAMTQLPDRERALVGFLIEDFYTELQPTGRLETLGKPVVGTGYSGNVDFMTADNACLVTAPVVTTDTAHGTLARNP